MEFLSHCCEGRAWGVVLVHTRSGQRGQSVDTRDIWAEAEVLSRFAAELDGGGLDGPASGFEPKRGEPMWASALPGRVPGESLEAETREGATTAPGPRSIILDCGTSRADGYTHVLWISPSAESVLGSDGFARLGEIVGRVYGVTNYEWEGLDRLHVSAAGLAWEDLLAESREALAVYMAGKL